MPWYGVFNDFGRARLSHSEQSKLSKYRARLTIIAKGLQATRSSSAHLQKLLWSMEEARARSADYEQLRSQLDGKAVLSPSHLNNNKADPAAYHNTGRAQGGRIRHPGNPHLHRRAGAAEQAAALTASALRAHSNATDRHARTASAQSLQLTGSAAVPPARSTAEPMAARLECRAPAQDQLPRGASGALQCKSAAMQTQALQRAASTGPDGGPFPEAVRSASCDPVRVSNSSAMHHSKTAAAHKSVVQRVSEQSSAAQRAATLRQDSGSSHQPRLKVCQSVSTLVTLRLAVQSDCVCIALQGTSILTLEPSHVPRYCARCRC
jgi:hypothetical protein